MPGPKKQDPNLSPWGALQILLGDTLIGYLCDQAKRVTTANGWNDDTSVDAFWKYWVAVISHGLVQYPEERDAYVAAKSSISGLLSNDFLRTLHHFEGWQHAKQMFVAEKEFLTDSFNGKAEALWVPTQYDFL